MSVSSSMKYWPKMSADLSQEELQSLVAAIQAQLYLTLEGDDQFWDPDKEISGADFIAWLSDCFRNYGLAPSQRVCIR